MKTALLAVLVIVASVGAAHAQAGGDVPMAPATYPSVGESSATQEPQWSTTADSNFPANFRVDPLEVGVAALRAGEFELAEGVLDDVLRTKPTSADANFYMGVAKMNLGEWQEAKKHLEIAVQKKPKHPDPKSRLGVTLARLGDTAAANAQRAELVKMNEACRDCRLSPYIRGGIDMIDKALAKASG